MSDHDKRQPVLLGRKAYVAAQALLGEDDRAALLVGTDSETPVNGLAFAEQEHMPAPTHGASSVYHVDHGTEDDTPSARRWVNAPFGASKGRVKATRKKKRGKK